MAAKGVMASDRKGSEDEDVAGGKLCGRHTSRPSAEKKKEILTMFSAAANLTQQLLSNRV